MTEIISLLKDAAGQDAVSEQEKMCFHTSFKVGGPADIFVKIQHEESLLRVLKVLKNADFPYYIMGNGTNMLVRDKGIRGVVIKICGGFDKITVESGIISAQAGALLSSIAARALQENLTGFEFASGIPGTLGGAVSMNAGAYDGEIKDVLISARVIENGEIKEYQNKELKLGYRKSIIPERDLVVVSAKIQLKEGIYADISKKMADLAARRREKQPLTQPSAGSTFKRPEGYFAGKLLTDAGLKGFILGGAMVSDKHAGFIVNKDNATAEDILQLICHCQNTVWEKFHIQLEPEVKIVGQE